MPKNNKKTTNDAPRSPAELQEAIRLRAYAIYQERGREDGHELEDWLQAEEEIAGTRTLAVAA